MLHVALGAVGFSVTSLAQVRIPLSQRGVIPCEPARVRHLESMTVSAEVVVVTARALRSTVGGYSTVLISELLIVRQADTVTLLALRGGMTHRAVRHVAHAVRLTPLLAMRDGKRTGRHANGAILLDMACITLGGGLRHVALQTRLHVVCADPLRGAVVSNVGVAVNTLLVRCTGGMVDPVAVGARDLLVDLLVTGQTLGIVHGLPVAALAVHQRNRHVEQLTEPERETVDRGGRHVAVDTLHARVRSSLGRCGELGVFAMARDTARLGHGQPRDGGEDDHQRQ